MARTFDEMMADIEKSAKEREVKVEAEKAAAASPAAARYPAYTLPPPESAAKPEPTPKPRAQKAVSAAPPAPDLTLPAAPRQPKAQVSAPKPPKPPKVQPALASPEPPKAEIVIPPDVKRDIDYKRFYNRAGGSLEYAKEAAASQFGMSVKELENVASAQGVDLESIHDQKIKGRTFDEVAAAARQRGTLGFLPVAEREAVFRKTVEDVERAERGEAKSDIPMVQSIESEGMLQGYFAPGLKREFDSVSQPGEYGYLTSTLLVNALKKDPEASRIWDLYGRGLATGNTQKYIEERAQDLMKRAGVGPNDPAAQDKYKAFRKRATNEVLAYKTIGQWTPAITMQDVQVTEGVEAPGFFAATGPNVELVGINNRGQAVFRQESALAVGFRFIDMPQAALVGTIQGQGAAAGVQTAANFMELALEGTKDAPTPVKIGAGVLGFAGAVLFPDLLLAAGAVPRAGRAMKGAYLIRKHGAEAVKLLETISVARRAGNYADAITAEQKLRRLVPGVADALDEGDAHAASVMGVVDPDTDILKDDMAAVFAAHVPAEKRLAAERIFLHPSVRKDKLSGKMLKRDVPMSVYSELYNTDELIRRVDDAVASYTARMPKSVDEYAAMYSRGATRDVLRPAVDSGVLTAQQVDEISDIVATVAPKALASMDDFADELRNVLKAHPEFSKPEYNVVRQSLYVPGTSRLRNVLDRKLKAIRGKAVADLQAPDLALFDRMKKGIVRSSEARGIAASLLRDEVAEIAKVKVQPLKAFDDVALVAPDGTPLRLSAGGTLFLRQLREALPKQDFQEAYAISVGVDAIVAKRAKNAGIDSFRVYSELLPQIRSATAEELQKFGRAVKAGGTPPAAPAAASAPTATSAAAATPVTPAAAAATSATPAPVTTVISTQGKWSDQVTRALGAQAPTPKGWSTADINTVDAAKSLLEQAVKGNVPRASRAFIGADGKTGAIAVHYGDVKLVAFNTAPDKLDVVVVVGDAAPQRIKGASDLRDGMLRAVDVAEARMAERVKNGEPAIKGAAVPPPAATGPVMASPVTGLTPAPSPVAAPAARASATAATEAVAADEIAEAVARVRAASGEAPSAAGIEELARAAEEAGLPVRRTAEGGVDVIVDPFRNVATADIVGRLESSLTETRVAVEELRRAVDSGAVGALDEYIDAAREHTRALSGSVGRVMERALRGDENAVEFIVRLGDEIDQLDVSAAATRAKAGRPAAPFFSVDELEGLRAARATEQAELRAARAAPAAKAAETAVEAAPEAAPAMSRVEALRKAVETEERAVKAAKGAVKTRRTQQLKMLQAELASAEAKAAKEAVSAAPATPVANVAADIAQEGAGETRPLKQLGAAGEVKGMVLNEKGKNVIVLFENADASTVLHEVAHIVRAGVLSQNDMDAVTRWIATKGVQVTHQNGEFVGAADDIRKAEELFAKAFEEYVRLGSTPNTRLAKVFDVLKTAVAHTYRTVVDPVIGQGLDPEIQRVFDDLLSEVPEAEAPSIKAIVKRMMVGGAGPGEERSVVDYLAREAQRKGIAKSTFDELTKNFEQADGRVFGQAEIAKRVERGESLTDAAAAVRKAFVGSKTQKLTARETGILAAVTRPSVTPDPIYLSFPVPVHGKKDWTLDALTEVQRQLDLETGVAKARERGILLDLRGESRAAGGAVIEETPLERLRANIAEDDADGKLTAQTKSLLRAVTFSFFGGDVVGELGMRKLPPALRKSVDTSARIIDQSLNDIVALTNDAAEFGDPRNMYRYLGGASDVRRLNGRPIVSAGHDYMGSVQQMMRRMIEDLPDDQKAAFRQVCDAVNLPQPARGRALITLGFDESLSFSQADAAIQTTRNAAAKALTRLVQSAEVAGEPDFGSAFTKALRSAIGDVPPTVRASHEFQLAEVMSYVSGFTARNGALFKGTSEEAARVFLTDVSKIYQSEETGRRVAVILGGYGAAALGKDVLVKMNLGISPEAYKAFNNWLVGEQWDPKYTVTIQRIVDEYGFNPQFVADNILDSTVYLPRAARERMVNSLARTTFSPSGAVGVGDGVGLAYRYMKVRMTRGNWFIKQRYYMMNTVDHFNQMGMQNGFGIAAASTARVLAQDVMVLPFWQQLVAAAAKTPIGKRIGPERLERFRAGLQNLGDRAADMIGSMFSASKYRIEVNPILEGVEGGFTAGGKVYSYRDVRSVAVQEGIFSSYDASQLANAIQREGALFFDTSMGGLSSITSATGKSRIKDFFADWQNTVSETAEAWSERERLGAMVTLMEFGYDPRTAARLTVDALYDYSRSMTKADRSLLTGVLFPFWAFQKNANQQVFNLIFSPSGAYRMMILRRARERSADAITAILYNSVGNEYGVDVESMPPDLQQSYYALITKFEESYPDSEPPEDAKRAMRLLLSGRGVGVEGGRYIQTSGALQELRNAGALAELQQYAVYAAPRPEKSSRPSRLRERAGIAVTFPRTEAARLYYSLVGDDHTYMELFYPESTIEAGMKHLTQVSAAYFLLGSAGADAFLGGTLKEGGLDEVKLNRVLQSVADPSRSPLLMPLLAGTSDEFATPVRVSKVLAGATEGVLTIHPFIGKLMDDAYGTTFLRTPAKEDPFVVDPDKGEMMGVPKEAADRLRALQKQYPDAGVIRDERYRIPGGTWSILFENSPLGELNALLLRWETKPLERTALRGQILRWARGAAGFDVEEISPQATIRVEEPKKLQYTKEI